MIPDRFQVAARQGLTCRNQHGASPRPAHPTPTTSAEISECGIHRSFELGAFRRDEDLRGRLRSAVPGQIHDRPEREGRVPGSLERRAEDGCGGESRGRAWPRPFHTWAVRPLTERRRSDAASVDAVPGRTSRRTRPARGRSWLEDPIPAPYRVFRLVNGPVRGYPPDVPWSQAPPAD